MSLAPPAGPPVADMPPAPAADDALVSRVPYLPGLDGMRAIAVVAVMVYHANSSWLSGGFLGVEMFFVISGYLITLLLIAEKERDYSISLKEFWMRRARRLLPALYVMMAIVIVWTALFEPDALGQLRGDVLAGLFYVSNWYQIIVGLGYTALADFAPLRHLWSLAVEEQFYLLWPLVMLVLLRRYGTRRISLASRWLVLAAIVITVLGAVIFPAGPIGSPEATPDAYWWIGDRPISKLDTLYLGTISRASGLLLGAGLAMVWRPYAVRRGPLRRKGHLFDLFAIVALVALAWMNWNYHLLTPDGTADARLFQGGMFWTSLATVVVIAAVAHQGAFMNRVLGNRLFLWIGTRSYGLYLYHWPIYQFIRTAAGNKLTVSEFLFAMVVTCIITELSYRLVETPIRRGRLSEMFRRARRNRPPRARTAVVGGVAFTSVTAMLLGVTLFSAEVKPNEVAESLDEGEEFITDLDDLDAVNAAAASTLPPATTVPVTTVPPTTAPPTTLVEEEEEPAKKQKKKKKKSTTTTEAKPKRTDPPVAPDGPQQRGLVTDMADVRPMIVPEVVGGIPLIALGDSVMLGAAEELQAAGFAVDAEVSRQMINFVPTMQTMQRRATYGAAVVVHLGTNGSFSQSTLDSMMATLVDVPIVVVLTGKADRGWVAGNNAMLRALPDRYPNTTVLDWEVLSQQCQGNCFYSDGIHLPTDGQNYYTGLVRQLLGLG